MKLGQNVCPNEIACELKMGYVGSLDQVLEKPSVRFRCHIFNPILIKLCQNVCLNEILDEIESVSYWVKN